VAINNSTLSGNSANGFSGGGIYNYSVVYLQQWHGDAPEQPCRESPSGGNCYGTTTSNRYNVSSDGTCNFTDTGDLKNTNPLLGPLQYNGGPTQTMALLAGSPAIDAGNPGGCTDDRGRLLKTDQRG
jgi:hypothetical protein